MVEDQTYSAQRNLVGLRKVEFELLLIIKTSEPLLEDLVRDTFLLQLIGLGTLVVDRDPESPQLVIADHLVRKSSVRGIRS